MYAPTKLWAWRSIILFSSVGFVIFFVASIQKELSLISWYSSGKWTPARAGRVAICISGDVRTFSIEDVHASILQHAVYPISRSFDTDVFFSVAVDDDTRDSQLKMQILSDAVNTFKPVSVKLESAGVYDEHSRKVIQPQDRYEWLRAPDKCGPQMMDSLIRLPHTLYRASQCLHSIEEQEQKTGVRYDWVYRLRPDIVLFEDILTPDYLQQDVYYSNQGRTNVTQRIGKYWILTRGHGGFGAIADQMSMSSRSVADNMLRAWDAVDDCELYQTGFLPLPEDVLRFWALKTKQAYSTVPFNWAIVRADSGAECKRLYYQHGIAPNGVVADWKRWIINCHHYNLQRTNLFPLAAKSKKALLMESYRTRPPTDILTL